MIVRFLFEQEITPNGLFFNLAYSPILCDILEVQKKGILMSNTKYMNYKILTLT
jgi:hypothetical protein